MAEIDTEPAGKVPFHLPGIRKPQLEYRIEVDNSNKPFVHTGLEKNEDGTRFLHPLEKLDVRDFVDRGVVGDCEEPVRPPSLEDTPFMFVEKVQDLEVLVERLEDVNEFAIDLEHNHFRSFQGLTCLMQISTRREDFVVDTLKLHAHVGSHLQKIFRDPSKRKVMHGADSDIMWLQKDFGIYVCNMFDTGKASQVLKLEKKSLGYLLSHYCGVIANKEYQRSDWRLRPLPEEMVKYARDDTHYLLYLYDIMRQDLIAVSSENTDALLEVYKLSFNISLQLYEKELITDTSYLCILGLDEADFSSEQLAVVAGLYEWRDKVARTVDEGTAYILLNKGLLQIARHMPVTPGKLIHLVKSRYPIVVSNQNLVVRVIRNAIWNASAFEKVSERLRKRRWESIIQASELKKQASGNGVNPQHAAPKQDTNAPPSSKYDRTRMTIENHRENGRLFSLRTSNTVKASAQMLSTKPSGLSRALELKSSAKRKPSPRPTGKSSEKEKVEMKIEQVRCSDRINTDQVEKVDTCNVAFPESREPDNDKPSTAKKAIELNETSFPKHRKLGIDNPSITNKSVEIIDLESGSSEASEEISRKDGFLKNREYDSKSHASKAAVEIIDLDGSSSEAETEETSRREEEEEEACRMKHKECFEHAASRKRMRFTSMHGEEICTEGRNPSCHASVDSTGDSSDTSFSFDYSD